MAKKILCYVTSPLNHDGKPYAIGEEVEVTHAQAAALVASGTVSLDPPADPPAAEDGETAAVDETTTDE